MRYGYLHRDVLKIFRSVKARTLISWCERGLITPDVSDASGRGSSRVYSFFNLIQIGVTHEFLRYGIPFSVIGSVMNDQITAKLRESNDFDVVLWTYLRTPDVEPSPPRPDVLPRASDPSAIQAPLSLVTSRGTRVGPTLCVSIDDFLADGGRLMLGRPAGEVSSIIAVNVQGIKTFVMGQITGLR